MAKGQLDDAERDPMHDVFTKTAVDVVNDIERVLIQPRLDTTPVQPKDFRGMDTGWLTRATTALQASGFTHLRDIDGTPLTADGSPPTMIRVMLGDGGTVSAALYHVRPRSPGFFTKLLLMILGKWPKAPRIVELTSYFDDIVVLTVNQGDISPFQQPPWVLHRTLPVDTDIGAILASHRRRVSEIAGGITPRVFAGFDDLNRIRDEKRVATNTWRASVGLMRDELDRMLAPHGEGGVKMRPYIERELARRFKPASGSAASTTE
jgi:hypothetical protein